MRRVVRTMMSELTTGRSERWKTIRAAVRGGWGPTLRYVLIAAVPPGMTALVLLAASALR
jgi:hypothetical protein